MQISVLHTGDKSDQARAFQRAMNRRLVARGLAELQVKVDGVVGASTLRAARTCAWVLGASRDTLDHIRNRREIPIGVSRMVRNPGRRNETQRALARKRLASLRKQRKLRAKKADTVSPERRAICNAAKEAAANYRANPGAYHYLAGGKPNTVIMKPTPLDWRSDCSQLAVNCYRHANVPCPGSGTYLYSNTISIERGGRITAHPRPGDLGMYGMRGHTRHVEVYIGEPGREFIGHGSPPIDSLTPGRPSFYLTFLND